MIDARALARRERALWAVAAALWLAIGLAAAVEDLATPRMAFAAPAEPAEHAVLTLPPPPAPPVQRCNTRTRPAHLPGPEDHAAWLAAHGGRSVTRSSDRRRDQRAREIS